MQASHAVRTASILKYMRLNVEVIVKINWKVFANLNRKKNKFDENKKCLVGEEYQQECENFIIRSLNHETFVNEYSILHYLHLMINDVIKIILKINLGTENYDFENVIFSVNIFEGYSMVYIVSRLFLMINYTFL